MSDLYREAELYCAAFDWPVDAEVRWALDQVPATTRVLEPMCGNARYGPAFVRHGVTYHGFDLADEMLAHAPRAPGITVLQADARSFAIPEHAFDLAWCPINSIRHLVADRDLVAHLACVRDHLSDIGIYIVETALHHHDGPWERPADTRGLWTMPQPDGSEIRASWSIERCDLASRRMRERAHIARVVDGQVVQEVEHAYEMRLLTADDWSRLTDAAGFDIQAVYAHRPRNERPRVALSPALENAAENHYFVLRSR